MDDRSEVILGQLRAMGGRVTGPRRLVVEALVGAPGHHLTVPDVLAAVRRTDPDFHESTVYRTLDRLTDLGVVTRLEDSGGPTVFHLPQRAHHHLVCEQCGTVIGADPDLLASVAAQVEQEHGFELRSEAVTLPGRCRSCVEGGDGSFAATSHG